MTTTAHPELDGLGRYDYGWSDKTDAGATARRGLSEEVVRDISSKKNEPQWMLDLAPTTHVGTPPQGAVDTAGLVALMLVAIALLAGGFAAQVRRIRTVIEALSLEVATPAEAREMLKLKGRDNVAF